MEEFIVFFENIATDTPKKLGWVISCLLFTWLLEAIIPLVRHDYNKWKHDGVNLIFFLFTALVNLLIGLMAISVFVWIENGGFGILNWVGLPLWAELAIAVAKTSFAGGTGTDVFKLSCFTPTATGVAEDELTLASATDTLIKVSVPQDLTVGSFVAGDQISFQVTSRTAKSNILFHTAS